MTEILGADGRPADQVQVIQAAQSVFLETLDRSRWFGFVGIAAPSRENPHQTLTSTGMNFLARSNLPLARDMLLALLAKVEDEIAAEFGHEAPPEILPFDPGEGQNNGTN